MLAVFIIFLVLTIAFGSGMIYFFVQREETKKKVLSSSSKIAALVKLNQEIAFHDIGYRFYFSRHYDNKNNFNRVEPSFIMTAEIKSNIDFYSDYANKIKENRNKYNFYQQQIQTILVTQSVIDYDVMRISQSVYDRYERKLFSKYVLSPVIDCQFMTKMTYSSPKGQVNLSKSASFNFDEMFVCLESVSRTNIDRSTYSRLIAVERGEISDSLRYDILHRDNFACVICGASQRFGVRLHVDHIIPVSKGGKSTPDNLRTLCERCNIGKSNKIETTPNQMQNTAICNFCGSNLVLRKGKYGDFYGCVNYPKCRFTKKIDE